MSGRQPQYAKKNKEQHPKRKYPKASRGGVVSDSPVWEYDAYRDRRLTGTSRPKAFQQALERCGKTGSSLKQTLTEKIPPKVPHSDLPVRASEAPAKTTILHMSTLKMLLPRL